MTLFEQEHTQEMNSSSSLMYNPYIIIFLSTQSLRKHFTFYPTW